MKGRPAPSGMSIVELVVAAAIILSIVTAATGAWILYFNLSTGSAVRTQAALLTEEAAEALNYLRDKSWSKNIAPLTVNTPYYIYWNGSTYATSTTAVAVNSIYSVSFILGSVNRDFNKDVASAGTADPRTRFATVTVATLGTSSQNILSTQILIHDLFQN